ncbi:MAG: hypothetical protein WC979_01625 [Candidatus Pacearchaeota archaeon]|jgi:hypothetical protein|nr:hypothetical protein [Clostridia bacterium]
MTRQEFIQQIKDELTVACALPYAIPDKEFNRIIDLALKWAYINYQYSVETHYFVIKKDVFQSAEFKKTRSVQLPDCVVSVYEVKEIKGNSRITYFGADFSAEKMIAQEIYLSPFNADDMVLRTAYESYWDLSRAFFLDRIAYDFNHNTRRLVILGRDPKADVFMQAYIKIAEDKMFEDWTFQRYCTAQAKISLGRILTMFTYNLPGGVTINGEGIKSEGQDEIKELLEKIDSENSPDWFMIFH